MHGFGSCIALYVLLGAARLLHNSDLERLSPFISVSILMGFAIVHGIRRYGWRHFVVFFIVTFVVSWSYETLSILTGFPIRPLRLHRQAWSKACGWCRC